MATKIAVVKLCFLSVAVAVAVAPNESATYERSVCKNKYSFLGVANTECLHDNLPIAVFLVAVIIVLSLGFERFIEWLRHSISCPQLLRIVNRIFEEIMVLGFISMIIFILNTTNLMNHFYFRFGELSATEKLHFVEFFHYIVFIAMMYYILIVLLLLFIGTVMPRILWAIQRRDTETTNVSVGEDSLMDEQWYRDRNSQRSRIRSAGLVTRDRTSVFVEAPMNEVVGGSRAYSLLIQRFEREGYWIRLNIRKQWQLWKSLEILAYNICENRSGYIYKNPREMERLFHVSPPTATGLSPKMAPQTFPSMEQSQCPMYEQLSPMQLTFDRFHVLCMRNLLYHISHLHYGAFIILLVICIVPSSLPKHDNSIIVAIGAFFLSLNAAIFFKVLRILRGIVDDRLRVVSDKELRQREILQDQQSQRIRHGVKNKRIKLRTVAFAVRSIIRMQMSALCHRQLHYHDCRFWLRSPRFLLRLFQFATIGQAFYLVWLTLVQIYPVIKGYSTGNSLLFSMLLFPFLALFVITPLTMPSLVLVMSLTGFFVELNAKTHGSKREKSDVKHRIRYLRSSFLQSHHSLSQSGEERSAIEIPPSPNVERNSFSGTPFVRFEEVKENSFAQDTSYSRALCREQIQTLTEGVSASNLTLQQRYIRNITGSPNAQNKSPMPMPMPSNALNTLTHNESEEKEMENQNQTQNVSDAPTERLLIGFCSKYGGYAEDAI